MASINYKNYVIEDVSRQLPDSGKWTVEIWIIKYDGTEEKSKKFSAATTCTSKEEASDHCFKFGMQIIDGKVPGKSVADL